MKIIRSLLCSLIYQFLITVNTGAGKLHQSLIRHQVDWQAQQVWRTRVLSP